MTLLTFVAVVLFVSVPVLSFVSLVVVVLFVIASHSAAGSARRSVAPGRLQSERIGTRAVYALRFSLGFDPSEVEK